MVAKAGGNASGAAKRVGGGSGKAVQGRSKGLASSGKMQGFNPVKQTGGNRNAPRKGK